MIELQVAIHNVFYLQSMEEHQRVLEEAKEVAITRYVRFLQLRNSGIGNFTNTADLMSHPPLVILSFFYLLPYISLC